MGVFRGIPIVSPYAVLLGNKRRIRSLTGSAGFVTDSPQDFKGTGKVCMTGFVVPLSSRKARDPSRAGGKGSGLARLVRAGFPVPPGFVITTAAFREAITQVSALIKLSGPVPSFSADQLEAARRALLAWDMPAPLRRAVLDAYRRLAGPVAVRSSMVGEDSKAGSLAGQLDTVLEVDGEEALLDAVRRVLASAFGDRLWAYLAKSGPRTNPSMAVVVQRMVRAKVSGVAFSADPVTCEPGVVIEAVPGLGEDLVQGRVRPDRYRLDPGQRLAGSAPARPGGPLLDETKARELGGLVRSIAVLAAAPQDVEWAFDGRRFHVLQARPISSISGKTVYSRRMVSDMAPGLVKPLVWSTKYLSMAEKVFGRIFDALLGPTGADYTRLVARIHSRLYTDVTMLGGLFSRIGLPANFFEVVAREERAVHHRVRFRFRLRMAPAFLRFLSFALRELRAGKRLGPFLASQHRKLDEFRAMDGASRSPRELVGSLGRLVEAHAAAQWFIIVISMNMAVRRKILARLIASSCPGTSPGDVIKGYGRRESLAPFEAMKELAGEVRRLDRDLVARIADGTGFDFASVLAVSEPGRAVLDGFGRFMARYGFLSANGSDFSEVPWIENPRLVWRTVARLALTHDPPAPDAAGSHRDETIGRVRSRLGPLRRRMFDRLRASTVWFIAWRERVSLLMTEDSYLMRRCALALGAKLVERGALAEPGDVFFLFRDELERLASNGEGSEEIRARLRDRKAEIEADEALEPPDTFCGQEAPLRHAPSVEGLEFLSGIGGSAGVRKGRARIVHDPAREGLDLGPADILVVPFTDVGWTPILSGVAAIVAETGGQLSHTSIIAREFGVPAVVSVPGATRLIREGQVITVDGAAGRIYFDNGEGT
ncbi:MAG: PEP/pyruvate-binding domain-containing protein [Candidatus Aminicenantes bacterium]